MAEIQHRTKKDYALALIRELIMRGELDPGAHIRQTELAERLSISLTPVREALRQLEAEGLVAATAHHGVRVRSIDHTTLRNVYIARRLVEPYLAARGVLNLQAADITEAVSLLRELDGARARDDSVGVGRANYEFHFILYQRADAAALLETAKRLWVQYPWDVLSVVPRRIEASKVEHRAILAAMREGIPASAAVACARHLVTSYIDIETYLDPDNAIEDPFPIEGFETAVGPLPTPGCQPPTTKLPPAHPVRTPRPQ